MHLTISVACVRKYGRILNFVIDFDIFFCLSSVNLSGMDLGILSLMLELRRVSESGGSFAYLYNKGQGRMGFQS